MSRTQLYFLGVFLGFITGLSGGALIRPTIYSLECKRIASE